MSRAKEFSPRYLAPITSVLSPLGFVLLGTAVLLWILGASFGWAGSPAWRLHGQLAAGGLGRIHPGPQ